MLAPSREEEPLMQEEKQEATAGRLCVHESPGPPDLPQPARAAQEVRSVLESCLEEQKQNVFRGRIEAQTQHLERMRGKNGTAPQCNDRCDTYSEKQS